MTSYSSMAARGREESARVTRGRRRVIAERIEYRDRPPGTPYVSGHLIGACGHQLRWLAAVPCDEHGPWPMPYLTGKLGRRMTCQHDDCRIP